jgi:hypothetical protein
MRRVINKKVDAQGQTVLFRVIVELERDIETVLKEFESECYKELEEDN